MVPILSITLTVVGSTIGGDENTRCLPIARAALKTRATVGKVVERDVNVIGRTGANPWLVVLVGANVMVDHRPDARKRIDRTGVVRILRRRLGRYQSRNQHRGPVYFPRDRFIAVFESADDRPSGASVVGDEKRLVTSSEGPCEQLHRIYRVDPDARLGVLSDFAAVALRDKINHAKNERKIGR